MDRHGIPGAALAIAKQGKLMLARGYGWADVTTGAVVQPDTAFGLASLSKLMTAIATLRLVEMGKLSLDDPALLRIADIKPPRGARVDARLPRVTVRQCLNHSGGWDRLVQGDPIYWEPQICRAMKWRAPLTPEQFVTFMLGVPLNFDPGTQARYSNVGYILLGLIIARVSGKTYSRFVIEDVLKPAGVQRGSLHLFDGQYLEAEARRHLAGTLVALPAPRLPMVDAAGGWSMSAVDIVRLLTNLDGSRGKCILSEQTRKLMLAPPPEPIKPHKDGSHFGLGWDAVKVTDAGYSYFKDGSFQGMRTFMKRGSAGVNWALLYNASMEFDPQDRELTTHTVHEVRDLVEKWEKYPDLDLFNEVP
jgi:CubicO group peptidase (beta-lactamase class C family)